MKAAIYRQTGGPEVLKLEDVADPVPGEGDLLIRVEAISVEGGDLGQRANTPPGDPPRVLGYAAAGEVLAIGSAVTGFLPGQKVATFAFGGSHAELRAAPAATCWAVPEGLDIARAAAVPCGPGTAALALRLGALKPGQTVLILGAAGGVGLPTVQLAARAGARAIGTGSSPETLDKLREFGLIDAIATDGGSIGEQVRELLGGNRVDLLIDNIGGAALTDGLSCVKDGGRAVLVGVFGGRSHPLDAGYLLYRRLTVIGCFLGRVMHEPEVHAMVAELMERAAKGELQVPIDSEFTLADAAAGHARAEERGRIGRVILRA